MVWSTPATTPPPPASQTRQFGVRAPRASGPHRTTYRLPRRSAARYPWGAGSPSTGAPQQATGSETQARPSQITTLILDVFLRMLQAVGESGRDHLGYDEVLDKGWQGDTGIIHQHGAKFEGAIANLARRVPALVQLHPEHGLARGGLQLQAVRGAPSREHVNVTRGGGEDLGPLHDHVVSVLQWPRVLGDLVPHVRLPDLGQPPAH
mmetsp:Transcript_101043/g.231755  ORF Transcript_101043/g.231755 Transcript_101043/m.231755 type:complete len:207 (-) Transcript_101043:349-969(-)